MKLIELRKFSDERGNLLENTLPEIMSKSKHFFVSTSKPGVIRANHYHTRKQEWFCVVKGEARIVIEDIKTKQREETKITAADGKAFFMPKNTAHAIENIGDEELILVAFINEIFDPGNPDTFEYKLI